jgi:hypothetical protein
VLVAGWMTASNAPGGLFQLSSNCALRASVRTPITVSPSSNCRRLHQLQRVAVDSNSQRWIRPLQFWDFPKTTSASISAHQASQSFRLGATRMCSQYDVAFGGDFSSWQPVCRC